MFKGIPAIPESDRTMSGAILGLEAHRADLALFPVIRKSDGATPEEYKEIQKQLYEIFLRCTQGGFMNAWPKNDTFYLAVPDPATVAQSLGNEQEYFEDFLRTHCGWNKRDVSSCLKTFQTSEPLIWAQDCGEIVQKPGSSLRTVFHSSTDTSYEGFVKSLTEADPSSIATLPLPPGVSCEGGDLEVSWGPDGKVLLLLGRHRVLNYLKEARGVDATKRPVTTEELEAAKRAYSVQFGMPVVVVPEKALMEPSHACSELFHLDMVASIIDLHDGKAPRVFVPELAAGKVYDALFDQPLDAKLVASCRWELNAAAEQLASMGYKVVRLPFSDHPVRSPANFVKYRDEATGKYKVLLSKFPEALPVNNPQTPQHYFNSALGQLRNSGEVWQRTGSADAFHAFQQQVENTWKILDAIETAPNPMFDECAKRISAEGIEVTAVPSFCYGSGGMHCQVLK
jgi:hypothetical protein